MNKIKQTHIIIILVNLLVWLFPYNSYGQSVSDPMLAISTESSFHQIMEAGNNAYAKGKYHLAKWHYEQAKQIGTTNKRELVKLLERLGECWQKDDVLKKQDIAINHSITNCEQFKLLLNAGQYLLGAVKLAKDTFGITDPRVKILIQKLVVLVDRLKLIKQEHEYLEDLSPKPEKKIEEAKEGEKEKMKKCSICAEVILAAAKKCPKCHSIIECPKCSAIIETATKECPKCGFRLD